MAFDVVVETTVNGKPATMVLGEVDESERLGVESDIQWFYEGRKPLDGVLSYNVDAATRSAVRWADVKDIRIEER